MYFKLRPDRRSAGRHQSFVDPGRPLGRMPLGLALWLMILNSLVILAVTPAQASRPSELRSEMPPSSPSGSASHWPSDLPRPNAIVARPPVRFRDASASLPRQGTIGRSMDAELADVDADGDLDVLVAKEFAPNVLLVNDGNGGLANVSATQLPQVRHDSEDIAVGDFDRDGDLDVVFVSEDDRIHEYYLNDGRGSFGEAGEKRLTVTSVSNAVIPIDFEGDGDLDLLVGSAGQDLALANDGSGKFVDETAARLPVETNVTQDLELADVDGDEDLDLIQANEDGNRLLLNEGVGTFVDATAGRLPLPAAGEETRQAALGDVDRDGDVDIAFANVRFAMERDPQDRLLLNDGTGHFADVTATHLPPDAFSTVDVSLVDVDGDRDLDMLRANAFGGGYQLYTGDGAGRFVDATPRWFPAGLAGDGIDIAVGDLTGDGVMDLYLCDYRAADHLLVGVAQSQLWIPSLLNSFN